ncbi:lipopolysaccharide biosynthesis protein [Janthinobacterium fluminis]|uniref:Lipopolysaccharide biosynthesis protein n=1 Tax=Janthinobacterium fluminis TaxID=2987524 RepID=A0ABT5K1X5_9BURK|nr:lipopolysaccharide biosynthesis protein [Janthinobacterium fluminis]MDC8758879.1 lipopolysaccharide biosynthesis protein [Janthinobacterium fluminis]
MRFLRTGAIYAAANIASAAVPFLLLPLLTRVLSPLEYGLVVSFSLLVTLCMTVAGLNAHAALGVLWFKQPAEQMPAFSATALALAAASTLLVAALVGGVLALFPALGSGVSAGWGMAAAVTAGAGVLLQCRLVLWQSQHKALHNAVLQVLASLINVTFSLVAVLLLGLGDNGRNGAIALTAVLMAALSVGLFLRSGELRWAPDRAQLKTLVLFGLPLILHSLAGVLLGTADRWTVALKLGPQALGVYGAGAQLGMVMAILADAFVKAYGPWLYAKLASGKAADQHCAVGAIYTAMPAFVAIAAAVGLFLHLASGTLLGPQYQAATAVLPWFMLGGAFSGVYLCTSVLFFFSGRTGLLAATTLSAATCGAASTWLLVTALGSTGAAAGYALTQGLLALFTSAVAFRSFDLPWREPGKALSAWRRNAFAAGHSPSI